MDDEPLEGSLRNVVEQKTLRWIFVGELYSPSRFYCLDVNTVSFIHEDCLYQGKKFLRKKNIASFQEAFFHESKTDFPFLQLIFLQAEKVASGRQRRHAHWQFNLRRSGTVYSSYRQTLLIIFLMLLIKSSAKYLQRYESSAQVDLA